MRRKERILLHNLELKHDEKCTVQEVVQKQRT